MGDRFQAISLSGCMDQQTSDDIGFGSVFTHSMLFAIQRLQTQFRGEDYSVGKLFNKMLKEEARVFNSEQDMKLQCCSGIQPDEMAWPLIPQDSYWAPQFRLQMAMQRGRIRDQLPI